MLTAYQNATAALLQNPPAPTPLYSTANITTWINSARGQLAGEAECIRVIGNQALVSGTHSYPFTGITLPNAATAGYGGVLNVRTVWLVSGSGQLWMRPDTFESFSLFALNTPTPAQGSPTMWAQYGQGALGSIFLSPAPNAAATIDLDCVVYPVPLVDDTTPEAIPYLWTDAVPYFAAYLALLSAQSTARDADADKMLQRYEQFVQRARRSATPAVVPWAFEQTQIPGGISTPASAPARGGP